MEEMESQWVRRVGLNSPNQQRADPATNPRVEMPVESAARPRRLGPRAFPSERRAAISDHPITRDGFLLPISPLLLGFYSGFPGRKPLAMTRFVSACSTADGSRRLKCLGLCLTFLFVCTVVINVQPTRARAGMDMASPSLAESEPLPPPPVRDLPQAQLAATTKDLSLEMRTSPLALQLHVAHLELAAYRLREKGAYSCTFCKQESLEDGTAGEMQVMELKMRHAPFSLYMKWVEGGDTGRQILFVDNGPDSKMLVKLGGFKGKLLPPIKLDPQGDLARSESRHPITDMGLLKLTETILQYRQRDLANQHEVRWEMSSGEQYGDRPCHLFQIHYKSKTYEPTYRKSLVWMDRDLGLPVQVQNYGWGDEGVEVTAEELDEVTLIENYGYSDLDFATQLADGDFDKANPNYTFRR